MSRTHRTPIRNRKAWYKKETKSYRKVSNRQIRKLNNRLVYTRQYNRILYNKNTEGYLTH